MQGGIRRKKDLLPRHQGGNGAMKGKSFLTTPMKKILVYFTALFILFIMISISFADENSVDLKWELDNTVKTVMNMYYKNYNLKIEPVQDEEIKEEAPKSPQQAPRDGNKMDDAVGKSDTKATNAGTNAGANVGAKGVVKSEAKTATKGSEINEKGAGAAGKVSGGTRAAAAAAAKEGAADTNQAPADAANQAAAAAAAAAAAPPAAASKLL